MALQLGQIEIGARSCVDQSTGVVEEVETKIEQARRNGRTIDEQMILRQVPTSRANQQRRYILIEPVHSAVRVNEFNRALDRINQVDLALDEVAPSWSICVLEVGHKHPCS